MEIRRVRLGGSDNVQRYWYDDSGDGREVLKQLRGLAKFSPLAGDSIRIEQVSDMSIVAFRLRESGDSIIGAARWELEMAIGAKQTAVRGSRVDCPAVTARAR